MGNCFPFLWPFRWGRRSSPDLPEDLVIREILPRLPLKSLLKFKSVSKTWYNSIGDEPSLSSAYVNHPARRPTAGYIILANGLDIRHDKVLLVLQGENSDKILPWPLRNVSLDAQDRIDIAGSSKGLVLLVVTSSLGVEKSILLSNPLTREVRALPTPLTAARGEEMEGMFEQLVWCLGFDGARQEVKAVRVTQAWEEDNSRFLNFQVFNKSGESWTRLEPLFGYFLVRSKRPILLDGGFYFLALRDEKKDPKCDLIFFSFRDDKARHVVEVPRQTEGTHVRYRSLDVVLTKWKESSLGLMSFRNGQVFDFWVMGNSAGAGVTWTKLFVLSIAPFVFGLIGICGILSDRLLLWRESGRLGLELALSDPILADGDTHFVRTLPILTKLDNAYTLSLAYEFAPSLISVHRSFV